MSSITRQRIGRHTYLDESVSYWDSEKKAPRNKKVRIGKIDPESGGPIYKQEYIDRLASEGKPVEGLRTWDRFHRRPRAGLVAVGGASLNQAAEILDTIKDYGASYFLEAIARKIGLIEILARSLPDCWEEVFMLACYLIASDKPVMYCDDWIESNESMEVGRMSSQRVSDLLAGFGYGERNSFYKAWHKHIREQEYIALDITSVSSYSRQMTEVEWGYNRDHEDLPQINICMLFGEMSRLPVYQTVYSGSLKDVSTLEATLEELAALTGDREIMIVMDKGFFSAKNVNMLIGDDEREGYKFLVSVPFTSKFAKSQVESERKDIDRISNVVHTNGSPIRGIHKMRTWGAKGVKLHTHVYFNPEKEVKDRNELYGHVAYLQTAAQQAPDNWKFKEDYERYLIIRKSEKSDIGLTVNIREDVVAKELKTVGWFVLLSNRIDGVQHAYDVYRGKDVVEKAFLKYKNNLGLDRLRVHGDTRMHNKTFVAFIALIVSSHIYNVMKEKGLFKSMTFDRLLITLSKIKSATVGGAKILRPLTKEQKTIFEKFDVPLPKDIG
jgi:hypothetical protein